jgi:uncharacterized protein YcbK (DUF882 family)
LGDLSPHFSKAEFRDHRTGELVGPDRLLVEVLERIRALSGEPLRIVSGYRSAATNRAVGGARRSQHRLGRAADLPRGTCTVEQALAAGATGVGHCDGDVVHIDVRRIAVPLIFADCPRTW